MSTPNTPSHSVVHGTFRVERTYPQSPARVFRAFSDPQVKRRWFVEGEGWEIDEYTLDFRVGGQETARFRSEGGPPASNDTVFFDIVPDERIVSGYSMTYGGQRISASLSTVEFTPSGNGTLLVYTEQGAFLDGADQLSAREEGCRELFEQLARELDHA